MTGWRRSGRSAKEYASSIGVNAGTLSHWVWRFGHELWRGARSSGTLPAVIEAVGGASNDGFELELDQGRRLRIPAHINETALRRLLAVLEGSR